jgi:hypothetical protein
LNQAIVPIHYFASTTPLFNEPTCVSFSHVIQKYVVNQRNGLTYFLNTIGQVYSMPGAPYESIINVFVEFMLITDIDGVPGRIECL